MKADTTRLSDLLSINSMIFEIPIYQRNYEWSKDQCDKLFSDLESVIESNVPHFLGTIVYVAETGPHMSRISVVIDGQQRLTSCMLLLKALFDSMDNPVIKNQIENQYLKNPYIEENDHIKLKQVDKDQLAYQSVIKDYKNDFSNYKSSKIVLNYFEFLKLIENSKFTAEDLFAGFDKLNMVYIELVKNSLSEDPQSIFESLNSTGVSLNQSDLIRNFLLMGLPIFEQNRLYKDYWAEFQTKLPGDTIKDFIKVYLMIKNHDALNKNKAYESYRSFFINNHFTAEKALQDLSDVYQYYDMIKRDKVGDLTIDSSLKIINSFAVNSYDAYLVKILENLFAEKYTIESTRKIISLLENFCYRQKIMGERPLTPTSVLSLIKDINDDANVEFSRLKCSLFTKKFPTDLDIKNKLAKKDLYSSSKNTPIAKSILKIVESQFSKELVDFDKTQIEHIMPQILNANWKFEVSNAEMVNQTLGNTIGNLTLTMYNQELSNKSFNDKVAYYKDSNIAITRRISQKYRNWNANTIRERTLSITNIILEKYPMPKLSSADLTINNSGDYNIADSINVKGMVLISFRISNHEYKPSSWRELLIDLLNYLWEQDTDNFKIIKQDRPLYSRLFEGDDFNPQITLVNGDLINPKSVKSASDIISIANKICDMFDISDDVYFTITNRN